MRRTFLATCVIIPIWVAIELSALCARFQATFLVSLDNNTLQGDCFFLLHSFRCFFKVQNANASDKSSSSSLNQNNTSDRLFLSINLSFIRITLELLLHLPLLSSTKQYEWWSNQKYIYVLFFASSENNMKCAYSAAKYYINMFRKNFCNKTLLNLFHSELMWYWFMACVYGLRYNTFCCYCFFFPLFFRFVVHEEKRRMKSYFCKRANAVVCIMDRNVQMNSMAAKCVSELKRKMANIFNRTDFFFSFTMDCHFSSL